MGSQLGKYQLVAEMARGGMGIVYLAVAQGPARFNKLLVIKELKPEFVEDDVFLEMFLEEARLAARLSHPNIVQTYEVGEENRRHYIVMDYLDGVTLARVNRRKNPSFTRNMQLRVICEALAGLHYAHTLKDFDGTALGIVHRDVTPQNVFITFDGTAKIVDFGIAKALDSSIETRTGVLKGKPAYMSPEQIAGEVDARADVFSAGVMIWEAATGKRMWSKKGDVEVLAHMLKGDVPSIREHADVPEELCLIVEKALARERDDRYPSAAALQEALEDFLKNDPAATMREVGKIVGEIFSQERTGIRNTIESHLARLKSGAASDSGLPRLLTQDGKTPPGSERNLESSSGVSGVSGVSGGGTPGGSALSTGPGVFSDTPNGNKKKLLVLVVAASLLVTAVGFAIGLGARGNRSERTASVDTTDKNGSTPPPLPKASEPGPESKTSTPPATASVEAKAEPTSKGEPTGKVAASTPTTARPSFQAPVSRPAPAHPPVVPSPSPTPETRAPEPSEVKGQMGYLTLDTYPWTRVTADGKVIGDTPLIKVPMTAGTHVLVLENTAEKVKQTTTVVIKAGETMSKRLAF